MPTYSSSFSEFWPFEDTLGPNFSVTEQDENGYTYVGGVYYDPTHIYVSGSGFTYDDDGNLLSGQVSAIDFYTFYPERDFFLPFFFAALTDIDLSAQDVAQALEQSFTSTGPDQFAGVAALLEGHELVLNYHNPYASFGVTMQQAIHENMLPGQQVRIIGSPQDDVFLAFSAGSVVMGNGGNDVIRGQDGDDRLFGGHGDDTVRGEDGNDAILGGTGNDTLSGGGGEDRLTGGTGNDAMLGNAGQDTIAGDEGYDTLYGGAGDDMLSGGDQADNLLGQGGDDTLAGGAGLDRLFGGVGEDDLSGGDHDDALFGQWGNDLLAGDFGDDRLFGGAGFDTLIGGEGDDLLAGNFNADVFVFADGFGADTIADFAALNPYEQIDLSDVSAITDLQDLMLEHLTQSGENVLIDAGGGNMITLIGVNADDLDETDFIF